MHKWMWSLSAVALLGLSAGCNKGRNENASESGVVGKAESGRLGEEEAVENESFAEQRPEVIGGEDLADQEFYGTVTGVAANSITVRDKGGTTMTLQVDEDTRILREGRPAEKAQLQEGSQVRASYDELSGQYEATQVEVFPQAATPQGK